ncbi:MAG: sn-glycerol-3-phosphate ABC transporter substrate-binding protein UgpB [Oceanidesulfovibrio sp.]
MRSLILTLAAVFCLTAAGLAQAETEIQWWHAMGGANGEKIEEIAAGFNESQDDYKVVPVFKGNYSETLTGAIAAFRAGQPPHIVQVFEVGTATMMAAEGAVYPVHQLMEDASEPFDPASYLDAVFAYYTTTDGKLLSMPFNSSTPVLYYNKTAMEKAGLDPNNPPKTWGQLAEMSRAMIDAGAVQYGFTTGWQSWVQLENFGAWHNISFATLENGFGGLGTELLVNSDLHVRHIAQMADWQKDNIFKYGGRRGDPNPLFINGEAAFLMNSSAYYASVKQGSKHEFGISMLPYYDDVDDAPQNSIIGGATLWVLRGNDDADYKGVAKFFTYLSSPEVQADLHQFTGYVPITKAAYELSKEQGFYEENPGTDVAIKQLTLNEPTPNSKGLRLGNFVQIRDVINGELEAVWAGDKTAEQGLNAIVEQGNALLRKFEKANK